MSQTCGQFWKPKHDHNEPVLWHNRKQPGKTMFLLFWFILIPFFSVACTMNINFKFIYENNGHTKESTDYTCHRHKMDGLPVFASRAVWHVSFHVVFEVTVIDCHHVCGNCRPLFFRSCARKKTNWLTRSSISLPCKPVSSGIACFTLSVGTSSMAHKRCSVAFRIAEKCIWGKK